MLDFNMIFHIFIFFKLNDDARKFHSRTLHVCLLHVEIALKTKQLEAETTLVYDVLIRAIKKESAS